MDEERERERERERDAPYTFSLDMSVAGRTEAGLDFRACCFVCARVTAPEPRRLGGMSAPGEGGLGSLPLPAVPSTTREGSSGRGCSPAAATCALTASRLPTVRTVLFAKENT